MLVIDGRTGFGNGRVLPAGPLREPVAAAAARCHAAVLIGPDACAVRSSLCRRNCRCCGPIWCRMPAIAALAGRKSRLPLPASRAPDKFFDPLRQAGAILVAVRPFPDHHPYSSSDLARLSQEARATRRRSGHHAEGRGSPPPAVRDQVTVIGVGLAWQDPGEIDQFLGKAIVAGASSMHYPWDA